MEDNSICKNILGCPEPGFYGSDCSMPCPDLHCRYCHLETGACQGCEPGYHGHHCELSNFFCFENTKYSYTKTCFYKDETFKLIPLLTNSSILSFTPYHCLLRKTIYVNAYFYALYNAYNILQFVSLHVLSNIIWYMHDILFKQNVMKNTSELNVDIFVDIAKFATIQLKPVWMDVNQGSKEIIAC